MNTLADADKNIAVANVPGLIVDYDPTEAADLGAFEETALSEEDAMDSAIDLINAH
jgi:hypothetical protein